MEKKKKRKMPSMVILYYGLIIDGDWDFWNVPENLKEDVKALLIKKNFSHLVIEEDPEN